jgi:S-DNA-T family DNA segregation ATPase FtsK/SpoIIIE
VSEVTATNRAVGPFVADPAASSTSSVRRRVSDPVRRVTVALPPVPPDPTENNSGSSVAQMFMPMIGLLGFSLIYLINPSPTSILMGGALVLSTLASGVGMGISMRRRNTQRVRRKQLSYLFDLEQSAADAVGDLAVHYREMAAAFPPAVELPRVLLDPSHPLIRHREDPDFLFSRIGSGSAPLAGLDDIATGAADLAKLDPACAHAQTGVLSLLNGISDWPIAVPLTPGALYVYGSREDTRDLLRTLVLSACATHAPSDLRILIVAAPRRLNDWGWSRWLPHSAVPTGRATEAEAITILSARMSASDASGIPEPALLIIADDVDIASPLDTALEAAIVVDPAMTVVRVERSDFGSRAKARTISCESATEAVVELAEQGIHERVSIDAVDREIAEQVARALAGKNGYDTVDSPVHAGEIARVSAETMDAVTSLALATAEDASWLAEGHTGFLRATLGRDERDVPVTLDLKEPATGGDGPHGVVVGATGSGKSELLRTLVVSLAARHHSDDLAMLLADFKGGSTFLGLSEMPQVCGAITNLESDDALVVRAQLAIEGELHRRQEVLARYGVSAISEYRQRRQTGHPEWPALPHLLIIVDEFSELLGAHPGFVDTFASVGRLGRSLGLHLLLASQRLDEGKLRGLESHLSYRIALRTFTPADSVAAIGNREAYTLPSAPGSAIIRTSGDTFQYFQSDYVTAPIRDEAPAGASTPHVVVHIRDGADLTRDYPKEERGPVTEAYSLVDVASGALGRLVRQAHQIWLTPLPERLTLGELSRRETAGRQAGELPVTIGLLDEPRKQRQTIISIDMASSSAGIAIAGAAQTGKTTLLQTLVVSAAAAYPPARIGFMILDQGGGLFPLASVPHVMACHGRGDKAGRDHVLSYLRGSLAYREQLLRDESLNGLEGLRSAWNPAHTQRAGAADVVLIVDGFGDLSREDEELEPEIRDLLARGPGLGIHVVLTIGRWGELRTTLSELVPTKLEFGLNDIADSVYQRRQRYQIPRSQPGRALGSQGLLQVAVPLLDIVNPDAGREPSLAASIEHVRGQWVGGEATRLQPLPELVGLDELRVVTGPTSSVVIGSSLDGGEPVTLDVLGEESNFIASGPAGSGKTNLLRVIVSQIIRNRSSGDVRFYVIDPRMKLTPNLPSEYIAGAAASSSRAVRLMAELHTELAGRLPAAGDGLSTMLAGTQWEGPRVFLILDDAHMMPRGILSPLEDLLPFAHLFGFGVIAAVSDADGASLVSPLTSLTNLSTPTVRLGSQRSGSRQRETVPPGRGSFSRVGESATPLQAAWLAPGGTNTIDDRASSRSIPTP